jgi:hypothetical protein
MAHSMTEIFDSRTGSVHGASGVNDTRTFRLTLDVDAEDFTNLRYPDPRIVAQSFVPMGSASPWNAFATASNFRIIKRETGKAWLIGIDYSIGAPTSTNDAEVGRWMISVRGSSITNHIVEEPAEAVASPPQPSSSGTRSGLRKLTAGPKALQAVVSDPVSHPIALPRFVTTSAASDFYAYSYETNENGAVSRITVNLFPTPHSTPVGFDAEYPALLYTMTSVFANFPDSLLQLLSSHYKRVNLIPWRGADPGKVKFDDFSVDEVAMIIGDGSTQLTKGIAYRLSLSFLWSSLKWTPLELVPTYADDTGAESPVLHMVGGQEQKVVESFRVIAGRDFADMIRQIERSA